MLENYSVLSAEFNGHELIVGFQPGVLADPAALARLTLLLALATGEGDIVDVYVNQCHSFKVTPLRRSLEDWESAPGRQSLLEELVGEMAGVADDPIFIAPSRQHAFGIEVAFSDSSMTRVPIAVRDYLVLMGVREVVVSPHAVYANSVLELFAPDWHGEPWEETEAKLRAFFNFNF